MANKRPFEEQQDSFVLDPMLDQLYFHHKDGTNLDVLTQLIKSRFGTSFVYRNRLEKIIDERLQRLQSSLNAKPMLL